MPKKINVVIYNEYYHEKHNDKVAAVYPDGIHGAIAAFLSKDTQIGKITCATLEDHTKVLTQKLLNNTDVLIWWGHVRHNEVDDAVVERVCERVNTGMGFIPLHSAHASKPFCKLMGTPAYKLRWRESDDRCRLWTIAQGHPIAQGLGEGFLVPADETYGEQFHIPQPDEIVFISWFSGGEVFRSGATFHRGAGKIFYFQNGHETYPIYYQAEVQRVIQNAVHWAAPAQRITTYDLGGNNAPALEQ